MGASETNPATIPVAATSPQAELAKILHSTTFQRSPRLCALLIHIVERSLDGHLDELTEQQIGIHVFQRTPGYNSSEDTIVRGTARHLRQRLEAYYAEEGRHDTLRLAIPKGGYVAKFADVTAGAPETPSIGEPPSPQPALLHWPLSARIVSLALGLLVALLACLTLFNQRQHSAPVDPGPQALWQILFTPSRKTLIVPGDAALDTYVAWEQRPVSLRDYTNQTYQNEVTTSRPPNSIDVPLANRSVTPMADLRLVSELVRVPSRMGRPDLEPLVGIKYARDLVVADTHENNLIIIGSETFNPWTTLYQPSLDFHAHWDFKTDLYSVVNSNPQPGEFTHYDYNRNSHIVNDSAITHLALTDNSQGEGRVLIIEGTSMGTTYAAVAFLTDERLWKPVLTAATDSKGQLHNFEVLLSSDFVRGGISNVRRIALHVH